MTKRDIVKLALEGKPVPYTPWSVDMTLRAAEKLQASFGVTADDFDNHIHAFGYGGFSDLGNCHVRDYFGVVWDRTEDKDIGVVSNLLLPEPSLKGFSFPNTRPPGYFEKMARECEEDRECFKLFDIGFSLFERAWTLRGMERLMMDFYDNPEFVHELLDAIADYNIAHASEAMKCDIDAVYFGDDWGAQKGLLMGPDIWREFIKPRLARMYRAVHDKGLYVFIHSCGDVSSLFDDLVEAGLNCFNPFQPEVMDVHAIHAAYHGRLCFHGGLSTQKTLPYGSVDDVRRESQSLIKMGLSGGYIFSPAHATPGDVPPENIMAFLDELKSQPGYKEMLSSKGATFAAK